MCIICLKPAGVDLPSDKEIKHMFDKNPHGAGFALQGDVHGDGRFIVEYHKGFMNVDDLLEALGPREKLKDLNVAIHCRIKTSGETDKFTTHPFPISDQYADLRTLDGTGAVLFHNGIFSGLGGLIDPKSSDTQDFVVGVANRYLKNAKMPGKVSQHIVGKIAGDCRVLVMYPKKKFPILRFGTWHEHNGCWYSNTGYYDPAYEYKYSSHYHYGHGYSSSYAKRKAIDTSYRHELDDWGCNVADYAWPSAEDDWIRFDDDRWERLMTQLQNTKERAGEVIGTFACTGVKEWIIDEANKQIYTQARKDDVQLRQDEEDYLVMMMESGEVVVEDEYMWFADDMTMLDWLDGCKKLGEYEFEFNGKKWMIDTVNLEAYTEQGIREYYDTGRVGHVRRELVTTGTYTGHRPEMVIRDYDDEEEDKELVNALPGVLDDDDDEEWDARYGRGTA